MLFYPNLTCTVMDMDFIICGHVNKCQLPKYFVGTVYAETEAYTLLLLLKYLIQLL